MKLIKVKRNRMYTVMSGSGEIGVGDTVVVHSTNGTFTVTRYRESIPPTVIRYDNLPEVEVI